MKRLLALLLLASPARAQDVPLELKGNVVVVKVDRVVVVQEDRTVVKGLPFTVSAPATPKTLYFWTVPSGVISVDKGNTLEITAAPKGEATVHVKAVSIKDGDFYTTTGKITFNVGDVGPGPVPPPPPVPPSPPTPEPPAPIPTAGFRVLIMVETSDLSKLPASQVSVLTAKSIKDYLALRCIAGPDGTKEWRVWDKDVSTANVSKIWQEAFDRLKASPGGFPKILISNGETGFIGPLPTTTNETLELLKKYGGV